jgi:3-methylfumaryl-CoA hydratase
MSAVEHLKTWVGREQHRVETLGVFPARALAAALDHARLPSAGEFLPPSWHWLYFLDPTSSAATGPDGHAKRGDFLPPV